MKRFVILSILAVAATVSAGQPTITETETGIVVEYYGTPPEGGSDKAEQKIPPAPRSDGAMQSRKNYLSSQVDQLSKEIEALQQPSGTETEEETKKRETLLNEKRKQLELSEEELRGIKETAPETGEAQKPHYNPGRRSVRQNLMNELRKSGTVPSPSGQ